MLLKLHDESKQAAGHFLVMDQDGIFDEPNAGVMRFYPNSRLIIRRKSIQG